MFLRLGIFVMMFILIPKDFSFFVIVGWSFIKVGVCPFRARLFLDLFACPVFYLFWKLLDSLATFSVG